MRNYFILLCSLILFMVPVIIVNNLTKIFKVKSKAVGFFGKLKSIILPKYSGVIAVNNVSFEINEGEIVGFIGPNGAGKSTTLKMLTGILFPTSGKIDVLGFNPHEQRAKLAFKIGTIFGQRQQLLYHLPPIDSFNVFSKIYEIGKAEYKERLASLVKLFNLERYLYTPVRKLSLGERMRCEFVASVLHKPQVLFLDEPTIGLDIIAKKKVREFIKKLNEIEKTTIILTSHDLDDIEELCSRVIIINEGKILYDGSLDKIKKKLKYKILDVYFHEPLKVLPKIPNAKVIEQETFRIKLQVNRSKISVIELLDKYFKHCKIDDIIIEDPPIEEVIEQ